MNIRELIDQTEQQGYNPANARAKVCQDIVLKAISESDMNRNVTIKGGVVMRSIRYMRRGIKRLGSYR